MRVLLFYDAVYPETSGGVEHRNRQLAEALARLGHHVTIAGWFQEPPAAPPGVTYLRLPGRIPLYGDDGKRRTRASLHLAAAAARTNLSHYDVVETANIPYAHAIVLAANAKLRRRPLFVTWHEYWGRYWSAYAGRLTWPVHASIEWLTAQVGTDVCAVSQLTGTRLARRRRGASSVKVIPNGLATDRMVRAVDTAGDGGSPLVYAGRLLREKRVDLLLAAVARMRIECSGPLLTVIGTGPDAVRLRRIAGELDIVSRVRFTGRLESADEVWAEMARSQLAVQPSSREGFGMFPLEAMALGLPVVYCTSSESALPELVRNGIEGVAVNPEAGALAAAIEGLLRDGSRYTVMSEAAKTRAAMFDWVEIARQFESVVSPHLHAPRA